MTTDRRQRLRVKLPKSIWGFLGLRGHARVIDLSPGGAMIEHLEPRSPGESCVLGLRLAGVDLRLRTRIAWSQVHSAGKGPSGQAEIRFRSGLHFVDFPERVETHLRHYLATLREPEASTTGAVD